MFKLMCLELACINCILLRNIGMNKELNTILMSYQPLTIFWALTSSAQTEQINELLAGPQIKTMI